MGIIISFNVMENKAQKGLKFKFINIMCDEGRLSQFNGQVFSHLILFDVLLCFRQFYDCPFSLKVIYFSSCCVLITAIHKLKRKHHDSRTISFDSLFN